jgi:hypothetical protein
MPVPKKARKKYGTVVAAQTARLERKGGSPSEANKQAKAMADKMVADMGKKGTL